MRKMCSYSNWSKDALISRILSLESAVSSSTAQSATPQSASVNQPSVPNPASAPNSSVTAHAAQAPVSDKPKIKKKKEFDFSKFTTRRVAIRFAYLGWNYHGLAYQKEGHRTVEYEILRAFHRTKCIPSLDPSDCNLSRCGRTDADVSAMAQVISLDLRSVLPVEQHSDPSKDRAELDYLKILNSHLPADILAYQMCLRPPADFDARFSCMSRHYHYYFDGNGLDIEAMQAAASKFVGEHDFRNFCKIDGSKQITNFMRHILESRILPKDTSEGLYYLSLKGTAFLWNQVRSIMAILFLVGQGHEKPEIIDTLLDASKVPRRPAYEIAWGVPLVLYDCQFPENMEWKSSTYSSTEKLHNVWHSLLQRQAMTSLMINKVIPFTCDNHSERRVNTGEGIGKRCGKYTPVMQRTLAESAEVINQKWLLKKAKKQEESSGTNTD